MQNIMARGEGIAAGEKLKLSTKGEKDRELRKRWKEKELGKNHYKVV